MDKRQPISAPTWNLIVRTVLAAALAAFLVLRGVDLAPWSLAPLVITVCTGLLVRDWFDVALKIWVEKRKQHWIWVLLSPWILIVAACGLAYLVLMVLRPPDPSRFTPYPRADGLVADFTAGLGRPAKTVFDTEFSLLSDSSSNLGSHVSYTREVDRDAKEGQGFMRIRYDLEPSKSVEGFVGVYADFSFPPPRTFDVSRFDTIELRVRLPRSASEADVNVRFVLFSANVDTKTYAYPSVTLPLSAAAGEWQNLSIRLCDLTDPPFRTDLVSCDSRQVFRFAFVIVNRSAARNQSHLDIDEIRFRTSKE